jgi:epoxyqueuosine reductase
MDSPPTPAELAAALAAWARELGFAALGFAAAGPAQTWPRYEAWLTEGCAAGMAYLARNAAPRRDPRELLPECRTVICAAARYPTPATPGRGFAAYAQGADYHDVLRERLRELARRLAVLCPGVRHRVCVDSAPILEREWAARAGLGWIGRQGQLIHPAAGACLLLGELLVSVELPPSPPQPDRCGDCRRCVDACPTRAVREDRTLDARRCVSYLTIEHEGEIPAEWRSAVRGALFGCDRCTAACPWNHADDTEVMPELRPRPMPDAAAVAAMDEAAFEHAFKGTAVYRSGLARLRRHALLETQP